MKKHHKSTMTIMDFQKRYNTEEACRDALFKMRYPNGFHCPKCGCSKFCFINTRGKYQCKECRHQSSVTSGTVMDRTHLKLTIWLWAMYLFANDKRGCSAMQLSKQLGIRYSSAWFLLQRLRKAMQNRDEKYMLEGVVELDDSYFGSPTKGGKRGRGTDKMKVIVALQTNEGKPKYLKMKKLENLRGTTIGKYANANIKEGSRIESDAASSYKKPLAEKYMHHYEVFDPNGQHLVWLHTMISNAKSFIQGTYHGIASKHADLYLTEFCFRFNRRFFHETLFERLALAAVNAPICRFKSLVTNS